MLQVTMMVIIVYVGYCIVIKSKQAEQQMKNF